VYDLTAVHAVSGIDFRMRKSHEEAEYQKGRARILDKKRWNIKRKR
jgi:hypothetical protein